ncbi:hypothetical protein MNBD_GAMMA20-171, partial [hydrothermal vent metagenome]
MAGLGGQVRPHIAILIDAVSVPIFAARFITASGPDFSIGTHCCSVNG